VSKSEDLNNNLL